MSDPFVAEIRMFAGNFAPKGWALCNGQLLPISQNTALFSLLGTFYGGDGKSTFALPNLEGSTPVGQGQGAGLSERFLGEASGTDFITLLTSEIPIHNLTVPAEISTIGDGLHAIPYHCFFAREDASRQCLPECHNTARPDEPPGSGNQWQQAPAQQHAAVPGGDLHHRDAGRLSAAGLEVAQVVNLRQSGAHKDSASMGRERARAGGFVWR